MACFSNVSGFILILLSYNCDVSSGNNYDKQFSQMEQELLNVMDSILNLRRDLNKERTERRENTEVLNRKISQCTCEIQDRNQLQNYIDKVTVPSDVSECVDTKKIKNLERGLAKEKVLRIMTEEKVNSLEKELEKFRNLVESKLNEQNDHLKVQKAKVTVFENDIGQVNANVGSLKTNINNMASDIGFIRSDILSTKGDTGERLRNVEAKFKTIEENVENIRTNDLKAQKAKVSAFENDISQVNATVSNLKTYINNMASNIGIIRTDIRSTKADTEERFRNIEAWIKTVEGNVEKINSTLKTDVPKIAFHARVSNSLSQFSPGQTIIFDDVYINLGNGYQSNRGVFRVPVSGIYIVLVTVSSEGTSAPDYVVLRNGTPLCQASVATNTGIFIGSPCNAVLSLSVGDEIWARIGFYRSSDKIRGLLFTTFSVGLISMD